MKSRRRGTSSLFRRAAAAPTLRPPIRLTRGSANASWNPASIFSSRAVSLLLLLTVVAAVVVLMFVGIPKLLEDKGDKKVRESPRQWNPSAPPAEK